MAITGQYFHQEEDHFFLKFQSHGDVPRVFRVMIAEGTIKNGILEESLNGLVIYDLGSEDFDGGAHILQWGFNGDPDGARKAFEKLKTADWGWFLDFLRGQDAYQGNLEELVTIIEFERENEAKTRPGEKVELHENHKRALEAPEPGNLKTLIRVGAMAYGDEADMRTEEMKAMDANPEAPYRIPAIGHEEFVAELSKRGQCYGGDYMNAPAYLGWFCHLALPEDLSGKTGGYADEISDEFDELWDVHVEAVGRARLEEQLVPEFFNEFCDRDEYSTYFGDDQGAYKFYHDGSGNLMLAEINGESLAFTASGGIEEAYARLSDESRKMLLNVVRSLDHDLSKPKLAADMEHRLNFLRYTKEEEWQAKRNQRATPGNSM
jgi:hypothetical protein